MVPSLPPVCFGSLSSRLKVCYAGRSGRSPRYKYRAAPDRRVGAAVLVLGALWCRLSRRRSRHRPARAPALGGGRALPGGASALIPGRGLVPGIGFEGQLWARYRHLSVSLTNAGQVSDPLLPLGILCQVAVTSPEQSLSARISCPESRRIAPPGSA